MAAHGNPVLSDSGCQGWQAHAAAAVHFQDASLKAFDALIKEVWAPRWPPSSIEDYYHLYRRMTATASALGLDVPLKSFPVSPSSIPAAASTVEQVRDLNCSCAARLCTMQAAGKLDELMCVTLTLVFCAQSHLAEAKV